MHPHLIKQIEKNGLYIEFTGYFKCAILPKGAIRIYPKEYDVILDKLIKDGYLTMQEARRMLWDHHARKGWRVGLKKTLIDKHKLQHNAWYIGYFSGLLIKDVDCKVVINKIKTYFPRILKRLKTNTPNLDTNTRSVNHLQPIVFIQNSDGTYGLDQEVIIEFIAQKTMNSSLLQINQVIDSANKRTSNEDPEDAPSAKRLNLS